MALSHTRHKRKFVVWPVVDDAELLIILKTYTAYLVRRNKKKEEEKLRNRILK